MNISTILNVKLFRQLKDQKEAPQASFSVVSDGSHSTIETAPVSSEAEPDATSYTHIPSELELSPTPDSVPNITQDGGLPLQQIYADNIGSVVSISCTIPGGSAINAPCACATPSCSCKRAASI